MEIWRVVVAVIASCSGAARTAELTVEPDELPASEEYVYAVDGVLCTAMQCVLGDPAVEVSTCCVRAIHAEFPYRPSSRAARAAKARASGAPPETLTREQVVAGVATVRGDVEACRARRHAPGKRGVVENAGAAESVYVKVRVVVAPDGRVAETSVDAAPSETETEAAFSACVAAAFRRARFAPSETGVTFRYPVRSAP